MLSTSTTAASLEMTVSSTNPGGIMNTKNTLAATAVLALGSLTTQAAGSSVKNVVLVHGGWVDGSGWSQVYRGLRKDGYNVTIVQIPTASLADDVAATKLAIS